MKILMRQGDSSVRPGETEQVNRGLNSKDPGCCAVVDGPGDENDNANYAVVDLETAKELLDEGESGLTCLIVTD